jgi:hypothetical protein
MVGVMGLDVLPFLLYSINLPHHITYCNNYKSTPYNILHLSGYHQRRLFTLREKSK